MKLRPSQVSRVLLLVLSMVSHLAVAEGANQVDGEFVNGVGPWEMNLKGAIKAMWTTEQTDNSPDSPIPMQRMDTATLEQINGPAVFRLGHSTVLLKLGEDYVLTDPMFSERASPFQWFGPKRFHPPPIDIGALPAIKAVVISHDHYDHLDKRSITELAEKVEHFVVPLGVGRHLSRWGVPQNSIIKLDWWQEVELGEITLAATPSQHLSGRGLLDRNETLWASWVIIAAGARIYFSGDTGYFDGFRDIGERYGPFDITLLENGAYNCAWRDIHMMPEDSIQAHIDLGGKLMVPIHNSTFDLALHPWYEPMERVKALAMNRGIRVAIPVIGATLPLLGSTPTYAWWRGCCGPADTIDARVLTTAYASPQQDAEQINARRNRQEVQSRVENSVDRTTEGESAQ